VDDWFSFARKNTWMPAVKERVEKGEIILKMGSTVSSSLLPLKEPNAYNSGTDYAYNNLAIGGDNDHAAHGGQFNHALLKDENAVPEEKTGHKNKPLDENDNEPKYLKTGPKKRKFDCIDGYYKCPCMSRDPALKNHTKELAYVASEQANDGKEGRNEATERISV